MTGNTIGIILSQRDLDRLKGVHPDLVRLVKAVAKTAKQNDAFFVLEGVRTKEQACINYGKGRTVAECAAKGVPTAYAQPSLQKVTWLNNPLSTKHLPQSDGYSHAVDLAPYPLDWNDIKRFDKLAKLVLSVAKKEGVKIRWGADWDNDGKPHEKGESDSPHFELA